MLANVFFVPGMFGSTIEFVLRNYTHDFESVAGEVLGDGSLHSYTKNCHPTHSNDIEVASKLITENNNINYITTPIYPFETRNIDQIIHEYEKADLLRGNANILLYAPDQRHCELNILFQYYKIAYGSLQMGLNIFSQPSHPEKWNSDYKSADDLSRWEYREWFSIFYPQWTSKWRDSENLVKNNFLKISNGNFLKNPSECIEDIIFSYNFKKNGDFSKFFFDWKNKQNYIVEKQKLLDNIVDAALSNENFKWDSLTVIEEAIVQQKLRECGFEIMCDGLNVFPRESRYLYRLLYSY